MFRNALKIAAAVGLLLTTGTAAMADYPEKAIKVIVPNGAGGSTDITSRLVAEIFSKKLGANLAIVNMGGGGTSIGAMEAANSDPDGYTLLSTHEAFLTSSALGVNTLGPKSMTPIAQVAKEVIVLAVQKGSPMTDLGKFYDAARKGHAGPNLKLGVNPGAANHFFFLSGLAPIDHDVTFVPTGGGGSTLKALLGGTIDAGMFAVSESIEAIRSGDVVPIALFDGVRHADLPDTPTAAEQGHDVSVGLHYVWYAPKGTPDAHVATLAGALASSIADPIFNQKLLSRSITPELIIGEKLKSVLDQRYQTIETLARKYVTGK
jgi:tripartite-type tricarboxylate transporter receptor subunit TctC